MGENRAPILVNLFLHSNESEFIQKLQHEKKNPMSWPSISQMNSPSKVIRKMFPPIKPFFEVVHTECHCLIYVCTFRGLRYGAYRKIT
jgi:hypothetical protein